MRWQGGPRPLPFAVGEGEGWGGVLSVSYGQGREHDHTERPRGNRRMDTYRDRAERERYSRRVSMKEIVENDYNLNISRYVSTAEAEKEVDLKAVHIDLVSIEKELVDAKARHNAFLVELGLSPLP